MKRIYFRKKLIMTSEKKAIRVIDDLELKAVLDGFCVVGGRGNVPRSNGNDTEYRYSQARASTGC